MSDLMKIGADWGGSGVFKPFTSAISGAQRVTDSHGRFMDSTLAGRMYSGGTPITAISNATFTAATTGATATPIIGVWNPLTSRVNLVILQAQLSVTMTALQATGPGGFVWMVSTQNNAISTGSAPVNRFSLTATGSSAKYYPGAALTGMTGTLITLAASSMGGGSAENVAFLATAVAMQTQQAAYVENFDGSVVVPPGGVLALMATTTPVAHSAVAGILWEEVPLLVTV